MSTPIARIWRGRSRRLEASSGSADRTARLEPRDEEFLVRSVPEAEHHELAFFSGAAGAARSRD